jgi:hypothetical protein
MNVFQSDVNEVFGTPSGISYVPLVCFDTFVYFDHRFAISWLIPSPATFPDDCRHLIFGYCIDNHMDNMYVELFTYLFSSLLMTSVFFLRMIGMRN